MELNRKHFRAITFYNFLNLIFGDETLLRTSVYWWYGEFNRCCSSLQDEFRQGRPKSVVVPEIINAVRQLVLQDRYVIYGEIETILGISGTSIYSILHEHFTVKKFVCIGSHKICQSLKKASVDKSREMLQKYDRGASKHVYDIVTSDKSWIYANEPESKLYGCFKMSQKLLAHKTEHVAIVPLEHCRTVNSVSYTTIYLPVVWKKNRRWRITLYHDYTSSHTPAQTTAIVETQNIDSKSNPTYSPDLAPNDFILFPYVTNKLMRSECMFWRYFNQRGKSTSTIGSNACKSV